MIDIYYKPNLLKQLIDWTSYCLLDQDKSYDVSGIASVSSPLVKM